MRKILWILLIGIGLNHCVSAQQMVTYNSQLAQINNLDRNMLTKFSVWDAQHQIEIVLSHLGDIPAIQSILSEYRTRKQALWATIVDYEKAHQTELSTAFNSSSTTLPDLTPMIIKATAESNTVDQFIQTETATSTP